MSLELIDIRQGILNAIRELRNLNDIAKITREEIDREAKKRPDCEACIINRNPSEVIP